MTIVTHEIIFLCVTSKAKGKKNCPRTQNAALVHLLVQLRSEIITVQYLAIVESSGANYEVG